MSVTKSSIDDDIIISMEKFGASRIISIITAQQYEKKEKDFPFLILTLLVFSIRNIWQKMWLEKL